MQLNKHIQTFKAGHSRYPAGCVVVTDFDTVDENGAPTIKEYTLEAWAALQNTQPQG